MMTLSDRHAKVLDHLTVHVKPTRKVTATKVFETGKLILVPASLSIGSQLLDGKEKKLSDACVDLGTQATHPQTGVAVQVWINQTLPQKVDDRGNGGFCAPFWVVRFGDADAANMELSAPDSNGIPLMRNARRIEKGEELVVQKVSRDVAAEGDGAEAPSKKKAKRS